MLKQLPGRIARSLYRLRGFCSATIRGEDFICDSDHFRFWKAASKGAWEPHTFKVLETHLTPSSVYVDIGTWIGPTVIFGARKAERVYCFEPDPEAYRMLLTNVRLNKLNNVVPLNVALASQSERGKVGSLGSGLGDSMTSLLHSGDGESVTVLKMRWEDWLQLSGVTHVDLIKMDIEGGEFDLLPSMAGYLAEHQPTLYLSVHPQFLSEETRSERLNVLADTLSCYGTCTTEDGSPASVDDIRKAGKVSRETGFLFSR